MAFRSCLLFAFQADGKKRKEPEIPLVASPPTYATLASFHIPLNKFLEADFGAIDTTLVHEHPQPVKPPDATVLEVIVVLFQ